MTFKTQHIPGPRSVERGRCRDYPWMIVDPEIGEIGRMLDQNDAIRAANATALLDALGIVLGLIKKHGLGVELIEDEHALDARRFAKAKGAYEKTMMDLANRQGSGSYADQD